MPSLPSVCDIDAVLADPGLLGQRAQRVTAPAHTAYFRLDTQPPTLLALFPGRPDDAAFAVQTTPCLRTHAAPALPCRNADWPERDDAVVIESGAGVQIDAPSITQCAAVGAALASLHIAGRACTSGRPNPIGPAWWRERAALADTLPAERAALLREELRFQALHRLHDLPRGLIQGAPCRANVWWREASPAFIGFDRAATDLLLFDVALAASDWCADGEGLDRARTQALLQSYAEQRPFTALERGAWPVLLRAAALQAWLLTLDCGSADDVAVARLKRQTLSEADAHRLWPALARRPVLA